MLIYRAVLYCYYPLIIICTGKSENIPISTNPRPGLHHGTSGFSTALSSKLPTAHSVLPQGHIIFSG